MFSTTPNKLPSSVISVSRRNVYAWFDSEGCCGRGFVDNVKGGAFPFIVSLYAPSFREESVVDLRFFFPISWSRYVAIELRYRMYDCYREREYR